MCISSLSLSYPTPPTAHTNARTLGLEPYSNSAAHISPNRYAVRVGATAVAAYNVHKESAASFCTWRRPTATPTQRIILFVFLAWCLLTLIRRREERGLYVRVFSPTNVTTSHSAVKRTVYCCRPQKTSAAVSNHAGLAQ